MCIYNYIHHLCYIISYVFDCIAMCVVIPKPCLRPKGISQNTFIIIYMNLVGILEPCYPLKQTSQKHKLNMDMDIIEAMSISQNQL